MSKKKIINAPGNKLGLISQPDLMKELGVSSMTLLRWRNSGAIKAYTFNGRVYYKVDEILNMKEKKAPVKKKATKRKKTSK